MGRPSKLSPQRWAQLLRRLASGEKAADLSREFGVSKTSISKRVSQPAKDTQVLAERLAEVEVVIESLPVSQQCTVRTLADQLKGISSNVASAALAGSKTATRLATLANEKAEAMGVDLKDLPAIAALGKTANEAAGLAMGLLNANKGNAPTPDELFTPDVAAKMLSLQKGRQ